MASKITNYLLWCFMRFLLYSFLITFATYSINDLPKYALEFKRDVYKSAKLFNLELPQSIKNLLIKPMPFFKNILLTIFFSSTMAVLGFKFFQFTSGLLMTLMTLIKYNPLTPSKLKPGEPYRALSEKYPWIDFLIIELFALCMFINAFVDFKEEWLERFKDKEEYVINEEDTEEYKRKQEEKKQKQKDKKKKKVE